MDGVLQGAFGIAVAFYGLYILRNRRAVINFGRWYTHFAIRIDGKTAVIYALGLIIGGILIALPPAYQFIVNQPMPRDLVVWMPLVGVFLIPVAFVVAGASWMLRSANSPGDVD